jgi:hypothetical protein
MAVPRGGRVAVAKYLQQGLNGDVNPPTEERP